LVSTEGNEKYPDNNNLNSFIKNDPETSRSQNTCHALSFAKVGVIGGNEENIDPLKNKENTIDESIDVK
jgi:hypothetical protein